MIPKIVVVGYGSIGKRHLENLIKIGIKKLTLISKKDKPKSIILNKIKFLKNISEIKLNDKHFSSC